ncbi:MAG: hypothetical protein ACK5RL_06970 [Acidimicrobiales bacterium]
MGPEPSRQTGEVEHDQALVEAQLYIGEIQYNQDGFDPNSTEQATRMEAAVRNDWHDVIFAVNHGNAIGARLRGDDFRPFVTALSAAAAGSQDFALMAKALVVEIEFLDPGVYNDRVTAKLARATALLETGRGSAVMRPGAYIMCGLAYRQAQLWPIVEEMTVRAIEATDVPVPPTLRPILANSRRTAVYNQGYAIVGIAAQAYEMGKRDRIGRWKRSFEVHIKKEVFNGVNRWWADVTAIYALISALAGEAPRFRIPIPVDMEQGYGDLEGLAYLLLADAVKRSDSGELAEAGELAQEAMTLLERDPDPYRLGQGERSAAYTLALHLAAHAPPVSDAAVRYARHLTMFQAEARTQMIAADYDRRDMELHRLRAELATLGSVSAR